MHDVIQTRQLLCAVSLACFAVAGVANTAVAASVRSVLAASLAVVGVWLLAGSVRRLDRRRHARLSAGLWVAFLIVVPAHAVGLETVAAAVPGVTDAVVVSLTGLTWATLLGGGGATAFLAFREYGSSSEVDTPHPSRRDF